MKLNIEVDLQISDIPNDMYSEIANDVMGDSSIFLDVPKGIFVGCEWSNIMPGMSFKEIANKIIKEVRGTAYDKVEYIELLEQFIAAAEKVKPYLAQLKEE